MEIGVFDPGVKISQIDDLKGEQNYFKEVLRLEDMGKIVKVNKIFSTRDEAVSFINRTPGRGEDKLAEYIPKTEWILKNNDQAFEAIAVTDEVKGIRLDKMDPDKIEDDVLRQFDNFISDSLALYLEKGICPGVNLKNFVVSDDKKLFYVDSEPYPPYSIEPFEMAHARKQKMLKMFGALAQDKLPKTWEWIKKYEVQNYKKAKREKNRAKVVE